MITAASTKHDEDRLAACPSGAAAGDTFSVSGSMYGHCATPQPMHDGGDRADGEQPRRRWWAPQAAARASRSPQTAERMTSGSARDVRPSKR